MKSTINQAGPSSAEVTAAIAEMIRTVSARARDMAITAESLLLEELALDSLDLVAVVIELQDRFEVEIDPDEINSIRTVGELAASLHRQVRSAA
jgi:acyl carrier protein